MNSKRIILSGMIGVMLILIAVFLSNAGKAVARSDVQPMLSTVNWHMQTGKSGEVEGAWTTLKTTESGASFTFHAAQLKPGNVYTVWFVAINAPENCDSSPCTPSDILGKTDDVDAEVTYAAGHVAGKDGRATFSGYIPASDVPDGWFGNGFTNPLGADIHLVLNDHGPKIPELTSNMLHTYRGGCRDDSLPAAFPETAKNDGIPGPNTCTLYQTSIFEQ